MSRLTARIAASAFAIVLLVLVVRVATPRSSVASPLAQPNVCAPNPSPPATTPPSIRVDAPLPAARVTSPVTVSGEARVFEATVSLSLRDSQNREIASGFTTASAGAPAFGTFSTPFAFFVAAETAACLWVFEESAADGSPRNVVQVPLTLLPGTAPRLTRSLATGCTNVALTFPAGTPLTVVAAAITPTATLRSIFLSLGPDGRFAAFSPSAPAASDYTAVRQFPEAVFICTTAPAAIAMPDPRVR